VHKRSAFARKVHGLKAKLYNKKRFAEKAVIKKTIAQHKERGNKLRAGMHACSFFCILFFFYLRFLGFFLGSAAAGCLVFFFFFFFFFLFFFFHFQLGIFYFFFKTF
jgi:hypothetical protein